MKQFIKIVIVCIFLYVPMKSETYNADFSLKTSEVMPYKISNLLFGGFIEFVDDVVDSPNGIWAQDLLDRGFDVPNSDWTTSASWKIHSEGYGEYQTKLNPGGYNKRGVYEQYLSAKNTWTGSMLGVYQNVFQNDSVGFDFYLYFKGNIKKNANYEGLYLYVFDTTMTRLLKFYALGNPDSLNWRKTSVKVAPTKGYSRVTLLIAIIGDGWVSIDEASCMPSDNVKGVRKEQYDLLKNWKPGVLRFPGGGFVNCADNYWAESIGDIDQRKALIAGDGYRRMDFGYDEFIQLCNDLKIEPYIVTRVQNATPEEAANLVEYCNGGEVSTWGKIRAQNGHPAPYKVKYWEIGNEEFYFGDTYLTNYPNFYREMIKKDPSICFISCFDLWQSGEGFQRVMDSVGSITNIASNHPIVLNIPTEPATDEELYISNSCIGSNMLNISNTFEGWLINGGYFPKVKQAATEWGYSYEFWPWSPRDRAESGGSLDLGIYMGDQLFAFIRESKSLIMANITYQMNFIRTGFNKYTNERSIFGTPSYHVMAMMSNHFGENVFNTQLNSPTIEARTIKGLWNPNGHPWLDAIATGNNDTIFVYVINKHPKDSANVKMDLDTIPEHTDVNVYQLASSSYMDANTYENPNFVIPKEYKWEKAGNYVFPPHSFTILAIPRNYKPTDTSVNSDIISFNIYPNPTNDYINIHYNPTTSSPTIVSIIDILGVERLSGSLDGTSANNVLDISFLPPGFYYLRIGSGTNVYNSRIIKN